MNIAYLLKPKDSVVWINKSNTVRQAIEKFHHHTYTAMPVLTDDGKYFGTITEGDLLNFIIENPEPLTAELTSIETIIRKELNAPIGIGMDMNALYERIIAQNFVPVMDDRDMFIGIVTRQSVIKYLKSLV